MDLHRHRDITRIGFERCRVETRHHATSFYFASHVLPREKRKAAYAVYSFCRHADDTVDLATTGSHPGDLARSIRRLREELEAIYGSAPLTDPRHAALRTTVATYRIPKEYFLSLLRGVAMDVTKTRYSNFDELKEYCYCVASVVGLMMTRIFGVSDERALEQAADLGTAMQLTNILRDVGEDYRMGRIYLPEEDLVRFGVSETDLAAGKGGEAFTELMRFEIARARTYYARADRGIPLVTNDGSRYCVRLMRHTYAGILDAIEANHYDVFSRRAHVPLAEKFMLALGFHPGSFLKRARQNTPYRECGDDSPGYRSHLS